jgi:hypothetical protein
MSSDARTLSKRLVASFTSEARYCGRNGSRFAEEFLMLALEDVAKDGPFARVVEEWPGDPLDDCVALAVLGATHMLGLTGAAGTEVVFPSTGGNGRLESGFEILRKAVGLHLERVREWAREPVQTNEVARAATLYAGIRWASARSGLQAPEVDVVEFGASAGLLLGLDWYAYRLGPTESGDPASELTLSPRWLGEPPGWTGAAAPVITSRTGCDLRPRDIRSAEDRLRLKSFLWPDQIARHERFDQAAAVVDRHGGVKVHGYAASEFVGSAAMPPPRRDRVLLVLSSIFLVYVSDSERSAIDAAFRELSTRFREVWWISLENANGHADLDWRLYVGGQLHLMKLAHCEYQGQWIRWLR